MTKRALDEEELVLAEEKRPTNKDELVEWIYKTIEDAEEKEVEREHAVGEVPISVKETIDIIEEDVKTKGHEFACGGTIVQIHWELEHFSTSEAWKNYYDWRKRYLTTPRMGPSYDLARHNEHTFLCRLEREWNTKHPQLAISISYNYHNRYTLDKPCRIQLKE